MFNRHQIVVSLGLDLKKYTADLQRARQQSLQWARQLEGDLSKVLGNIGGGKVAGTFTQLNAAMGASSKTATQAGIRYQALTDRINVQQRQLAILRRELAATANTHGAASTLTTKQQIAVDRLSSSLNTNIQRQQALRTSMNATQQGTQKAGAAADVATKFFTAWGRGGSLAGAALSAVPYASVAAGVLGIVGAYKLLRPAVVDTNAQLEMSTRQWTVMLGGNKEAAAGLLGEFKQLANIAPFDFGDVNAAGKMLRGAGIPARELLGWLKDIGNVASTFGDNPAQGVESITRALAQMRTSGRVNAEDVGQLTTLGIPAWDILAEKIGFTVAETRKLSEAGKITSDVFIDAFRAWSQNNFAGAMEDAATTFTGSMATISDSLQYGSAAVFKPFFELIRDGAVALSDFVRSDEFAAWASKTAAYVSLAADATRALLAVIGVDLPTAEERAAQASTKVAAANVGTAAAVSKTKQKQDALNDSLADAKSRLEAAENALGPYEDAVSETGDTLDAAEKRFKRFADAAIEGTKAFDDAIFDAQQRGNQAKLDLLNFENGDLKDLLAPMQRDIDASADALEGWEDRLESANDAVERQKEVVSSISGDLGIFDQAFEASTRAVEDHTESLEEAEQQYKDVKDAMDAQFSALRGWNDAELLGTDKYRQALQGWDDKILDARRRLNDLERSGGGKDAIKRAREEIDRLQLEREAVELAQQADIDRAKRELDDRARMVSEVSVSDAAAGIDSAKAEIARLNGMLPEAAAAVEAEKAALGEANAQLAANEEARRLMIVRIDTEKGALERLEAARDTVRKGYDAEKQRLDDLKTAYDRTRDDALKPYTTAVEAAAVAEQRLTLQRGLALDALERERDLLLNPREELPWDEIEAGLKREALAVGEATVAHEAAEQALKDRKREIVLMRREVEGLGIDLANLSKAAGAPASSGMGDTSYQAPPEKEDGIFADTKRQAEEAWSGVRAAAEPVVSWFADTAFPVLRDNAKDMYEREWPALREGTKREFEIINAVGGRFADYWRDTVVPQWREAVRITREQELPQLKQAYEDTFGRAQTVIDNVTTWFKDEAWPRWSATYDAMREDGLNPLEAAFKTAWGLSPAGGMWKTVSDSAGGMLAAIKEKFGITEDEGIQGVVKAAAPTILKWVLHPYESANTSLLDAAGPLAALGITFKGWVDTATTVGGAIYEASLKMGGSIVDTLKAGITAGWETFTEWWQGQLAGLLSALPEPLQHLLGGAGGGGGPKVSPAYPNSGKYDANAVNDILKNTGLKGYGDEIVALAAASRVPVEYALAMLQKEASFLDPVNNISVKHNNPGNIKFTKTTEAYGATQGDAAEDGGYWAKFETVTQGLEGYFRLLRDVYGDWVDEGPDGFDKIIAKYAPPKSNDTAQYQQQVRAWAAAFLEQILATTAAPTAVPTDGTPLEQLIALMGQRGPLTQDYHSGNGWGGIDIGAAAGDPVRSVQAGKVVQSAYSEIGGFFVIIEDIVTGLKTYYGHLQEAGAAVGTLINAGDTIGKAGMSGPTSGPYKVTGPHVHFQAWLNDVLQNPMDILSLILEAAFGTGGGTDVPWDNVTPTNDAYTAQNTRRAGDPTLPKLVDPAEIERTQHHMEQLLALFAEMQATLDPNDPRSVDMWASRVREAILALGQTAGEVGKELDYVTKPVGDPTRWDTPTYGATDPTLPRLVDPGLLNASTDATQRLHDAWERFLALNGFGPDSPFASVVRDLSSMIDVGEEMRAGDPDDIPSILGDIATPLEDQASRAEYALDRIKLAFDDGDMELRDSVRDFGRPSGGGMYGIGEPLDIPRLNDGRIGEDFRYGITDPIGESLLRTTDTMDDLKDLFAPSYWAQPIDDNRMTWETIRDQAIEPIRQLLEYYRSASSIASGITKDLQNNAEQARAAASGIVNAGGGGGNNGGDGNTYNTFNTTVNTNSANKVLDNMRRKGWGG